MLKSELRKKILKVRKKFNTKNIQIDFNQIIKILKKEKITNKIIGGYYPVNFEIDDLTLLRKFKKDKFNISLPVIKKNFKMNFYKWSFSDLLKVNKYGIPEPEIKKKFQMNFYKWSFTDLLKINKYGIPEPETKNIVYPDVLLIPLVAFDKNLNRLGYGGGYYDRLIKKLSKKKKIIKIGLAFSVQKINKVSINIYDQKLDYIVTNKYTVK